MSKVIVLINELSPEPSDDELDVLDQALLVEEGLKNIGFKPERLFINLELPHTIEYLKSSKAEFVFNLVESLGNKAELIHIAPALLRSIPIAFTGCGPESMMMTSNKMITKEWLFLNNLPTPLWNEAALTNKKVKQIIKKPLWEDASVGITDDSIVSATDYKNYAEFVEKYGNQYFVEEFISGREFNVSVIEGDNGPEVLTPAEMIFVDFPENKPKIVGYAAKWDEKSFEYTNTIRSFEFGQGDKKLLEKIRDISLKCWKVFKLKGYARVDFRVSDEGDPYVLELNANPCIAPDSGFIAACNHAGLSNTDVVRRIISNLS